MNLPNSLTVLRIFFVPLLIVVLLTRSPNVELWGFPMHFEFWGVLILLTAAATDWADGYFARRRLQVTTLGILLDPIADKLLISAAFVSLVDMHLVPAWMVVIIIGREFTILGLRNIASSEGFTIEASVLGKAKMVLQVCAVAVLIAGARHPSLKPLALALLWLVVVSALVSAAQYFLRFWSRVDDRIKQRRKLNMLESRKKSQDAVPLCRRDPIAFGMGAPGDCIGRLRVATPGQHTQRWNFRGAARRFCNFACWRAFARLHRCDRKPRATWAEHCAVRHRRCSSRPAVFSSPRGRTRGTRN